MPRRPINSRGSELLNQIETMIEDELRHGTDQLGRRVTTRMALDFGGSSVYFPCDKWRRDAQIFKDFTGDNIPELRAKYKLNESTIYQILRQERARRRQQQVFLPGVMREKK